MKRLAFAFVLSVSALASCSDQSPARAQLVVVIDTDLPTVEQAASDETLSRDIAVDSLRVDVLSSDGTVQDFRDFVAPSALDWPISFGVLPASENVVLRLRAYQSKFATAGSLNGKATIEPAIEVAVDRVVILPKPVSGVSVARITLYGACIGAPSTFTAGMHSCIDGTHTDGDLTSGVEVSSDTSTHATLAGSWSLAHETPCMSTAPASAICIPGGFSLMGDASINDFPSRTLPRRLALMSPFFLDATEFTVGRYRALLNAKKVSVTPAADATDPDPAACTWAGASSATKDAYPLNCVTLAGAQAACAAVGGRLMSESQYEHAARGRGESREFPWGDEVPTCCATSMSRPNPATTTECTGKTVEPVSSHPLSASCGGIGDVSRDGVFDLGGSLSEWVQDFYQEFNAPCWSWTGYAQNPVCTVGTTPSSRGGNWSDGLDQAAGARHAVTEATALSYQGFRCAYKDAP